MKPKVVCDSAEYCDRKWCVGQKPHNKVDAGYGHVCGKACPHHPVGKQTCRAISSKKQ